MICRSPFRVFITVLICSGLLSSPVLATIAPSAQTLIKSAEVVVVGVIVKVHDLGQHVQEITVQAKEVLKDSNSHVEQGQTLTLLYGYHGKGWSDFSKLPKQDFIFYLTPLAEHRREGQPHRFKMVDSLFGFGFAQVWLADAKKALGQIKTKQLGQ